MKHGGGMEDRAKAVRAGTERKVVYIGSRKSELAMIQTKAREKHVGGAPWRQVHFHYQNNVYSRRRSA